MISRALGNAYVKDPLCSITNLYKACSALIAKPTLYSFPIDPTVDTAIVLVSDGITNHLDMNDMARAVESWHPKQPRNLAQTIVVAAGERAASKSGLTFRQLHSLAKGRERRSVWDDATCIAVHLFPRHVS
jgi:serine/threonine protein phosphatase PrpC